MPHRTPYLEALVLVCSIAPAELVRVFTSFGISEKSRRRLSRLSVVGIPAAYALVALLALVVALAHMSLGQLFPLEMDPTYLLLAVAVGGLTLALESGLASVQARLSHPLERQRFRVNLGGQALDERLVVSVLTTAVIEEVLYRGIWLGILQTAFHESALLAVPISAGGYALGHLFFGPRTVAQKVLSGLAFGSLFVLSGSIVVPIIAHLTENALILGLSYREMERT